LGERASNIDGFRYGILNRCRLASDSGDVLHNFCLRRPGWWRSSRQPELLRPPARGRSRLRSL
jgi:hypothetical protein